MSADSHVLVKLAHRAVEKYVRTGQRLSPLTDEELSPEMRERAGAFVSLHRLGELRGCVGTFVPQRENVAEEIVENAIASATRDPRFLPVAPQELDDLEISVDILSTPEPVDSVDKLDPNQFGVIVTDEVEDRRGLLLPMLEQVRSAEQQIAIARQKAFIGVDEPIHLYRFRVKRYH